jgi:hypothetical protein
MAVSDGRLKNSQIAQRCRRGARRGYSRTVGTELKLGFEQFLGNSCFTYKRSMTH